LQYALKLAWTSGAGHPRNLLPIANAASAATRAAKAVLPTDVFQHNEYNPDKRCEHLPLAVSYFSCFSRIQ
jgi:hypothetical protein